MEKNMTDPQRARQPKGSPTGGQYAPMDRAEADLDLSADGYMPDTDTTAGPMTFDNNTRYCAFDGHELPPGSDDPVCGEHSYWYAHAFEKMTFSGVDRMVQDHLKRRGYEGYTTGIEQTGGMTMNHVIYHDGVPIIRTLNEGEGGDPLNLYPYTSFHIDGEDPDGDYEDSLTGECIPDDSADTVPYTSVGALFNRWIDQHHNYHNQSRPVLTVDEEGTRWWVHEEGYLHRTDGPAVEWADGGFEWRDHGKKHRADGPAVRNPDGSEEWWLHGDKVSEEEHRRQTSR